jgi:SAM-dependent methyltransferase
MSRDTAAADETTMRIFQRDWQIYRKMVDNNLIYHREAYSRLRRLLVEEAVQPFRFLDIACGDGSATITALMGTQIAHYRGIDLSRPALDLAARELAALPCPVVLDQRDFFLALTDRPEPADVTWIGLSLHHFRAPDKLRLMRVVRAAIEPGGLFVIYENASPDGEDRAGWMTRWWQQKPLWTSYTEEDWDIMWTHVSTFDFPETNSTWRRLGHEAGFGTIRELFVAPSDLFRLYAFSV